jgi:hypothetical protein
VKRILSLVLVLGVAALFSSAALAGADCSYHKTQAAVPATDASKDVATVPADKTVMEPVQTAQANPQAPKPAPTPEVKK